MKNKPNVFITSFFRTKHHHLTETIKRQLGYTKATTVGTSRHGDDEHIMSIHQAQVLFPMEGLVFDQHMRATGNNSFLLKSHDMKVVVMLRDLYSCLSDLKKNFDDGNTAPGIQRPVYWDKLDQSKRFRWIAYNATPWFLSFYVSWMQSSIPTYFIWSEDYDKVPGATLSGILGFLGLEDWLTGPYTPLPFEHQVGPILGFGEDLPYECIEIIENQMESWGTKWEQKMREELIRGA